MQRLFEKGRSLTIGRSLTFILVLQIAVAGFLLMTDIGARWRFDTASEEPSIDTPVSPGDQVRRYEPTRLRPNYSDPGSRPNIDLPDDLPPRLEFTLGKDPDFGEMLIMHGQIASGDAERFSAYLESLEAPPDGVAINSPGGVVREALQIGRLIRDQGLDTRIVPGTACLSSCPYVLAGGVERRVSLASSVGLHQHYYDTPGYLPVFLAVEGIQRGQGKTMRHLIEMGIDPGVMIYSLTTPPNDIYLLVESELIESRMATEVTN
ncbi:MAG: COG3904 family protein [Roseovarius sp.]